MINEDDEEHSEDFVLVPSGSITGPAESDSDTDLDDDYDIKSNTADGSDVDEDADEDDDDDGADSQSVGMTPNDRPRSYIVADRLFAKTIELPILEKELLLLEKIWSEPFSLKRPFARLAASTCRGYKRLLRNFAKFLVSEHRWVLENPDQQNVSLTRGDTVGLPLSELQLVMLGRFVSSPTKDDPIKYAKDVQVNHVHTKYAETFYDVKYNPEYVANHLTILQILQQPYCPELLFHFVEKTTRVNRVLPTTIHKVIKVLGFEVLTLYQWRIDPSRLVRLQYALQNLQTQLIGYASQDVRRFKGVNINFTWFDIQLVRVSAIENFLESIRTVKNPQEASLQSALLAHRAAILCMLTIGPVSRSEMIKNLQFHTSLTFDTKHNKWAIDVRNALTKTARNKSTKQRDRYRVPLPWVWWPQSLFPKPWLSPWLAANPSNSTTYKKNKTPSLQNLSQPKKHVSFLNFVLYWIENLFHEKVKSTFAKAETFGKNPYLFPRGVMTPLSATKVSAVQSNLPLRNWSKFVRMAVQEAAPEVTKKWISRGLVPKNFRQLFETGIRSVLSELKTLAPEESKKTQRVAGFEKARETLLRIAAEVSQHTQTTAERTYVLPNFDWVESLQLSALLDAVCQQGWVAMPLEDSESHRGTSQGQGSWTQVKDMDPRLWIAPQALSVTEKFSTENPQLEPMLDLTHMEKHTNLLQIFELRELQDSLATGTTPAAAVAELQNTKMQKGTSEKKEKIKKKKKKKKNASATVDFGKDEIGSISGLQAPLEITPTSPRQEVIRELSKKWPSIWWARRQDKENVGKLSAFWKKNVAEHKFGASAGSSFMAPGWWKGVSSPKFPSQYQIRVDWAAYPGYIGSSHSKEKEGPVLAESSWETLNLSWYTLLREKLIVFVRKLRVKKIWAKLENRFLVEWSVQEKGQEVLRARTQAEVDEHWKKYKIQLPNIFTGKALDTSFSWEPTKQFVLGAGMIPKAFFSKLERDWRERNADAESQIEEYPALSQEALESFQNAREIFEESSKLIEPSKAKTKATHCRQCGGRK